MCGYVCVYVFVIEQEATAAIKPLLGKWYRYENTGMSGVASAVWSCVRDCRYVSADQDGSPHVMWFAPSKAPETTAINQPVMDKKSI